MIYIFDTNTLSSIFKHYYRDSFPSFWTRFDRMVTEGNILSVREVRNEIKNYSRKDEIESWVKNNLHFFQDPTPDELQFITTIASVPHFFKSISQKRLLKGEPIADPFVIAKARVASGTVVTQEEFKDNAAKIPNNLCTFSNPLYRFTGIP